jgi:hypothetical protein
MAKSLLITSHKEKKMEFKTKDEVVVVDEKTATVFQAMQVAEELTPEQVKAMNRRRMEAYSDCA